MVSVLERGIGDAPPARVFSALKRWVEKFGELSISKGVLLEAKDRSLLKEIYTSRSFKRFFKRLISSRTALVREWEVEALIRKLRERSYMPKVDRAAIPEVVSPPWTTEGQALYLLLAGLVYAHVSEAFDLPISIPPSLLSELEGYLSSAQRERIRAAAEEAIARLERAFEEGRRGAWEERPSLPSPPLEEILPKLERAIEGEALLRIGYLDRCGRLTERVIEPLLIEERKGRFYLIAYCHLRDGERVFRIDRISEIEPAPPYQCK
jgi:hypothetical protein